MPVTVKNIIKDFSTKAFKELDKFYLAVGEGLYFVDKLTVLLKNLALKENIEVETYLAGVEKQSFEEFLENSYSGSLFSESKVVIIRGGESLNQDAVNKFLSTVATSKSIITFMHVLKEDKRKKTFKDLRANSVNFDIKTPTAKTLDFWFAELARDKDLNLSTSMISLMESRLGTDLQIIDNELEKLKNYVMDKELTIEVIKEFINFNDHVSVFDFLEAFFARDKKKYAKYLYLLEESGENAVMIITLLMNRISKLILVKNPVDGQAVRLNPFYLKKLREEAKRFSYNELISLYRSFILIDKKLKSSKHGFDLLYSIDF